MTQSVLKPNIQNESRPPLIWDNRWIANHGIGRFAKEMYPTAPKRAIPPKGNFNTIFEPLDPIKLYRSCKKKRAWFISPGYNGPLGWASQTILTIHDLMLIQFKAYGNIKSRLYFANIVRRACRAAPFTFTVSQFTKQCICEWASIPEEKVVVVPNGISSAFNSNALPSQLERPYFLAFANSKAHKNIPGILQGFKNSVASKTHLLLFIGNENKEIAQEAQALGLESQIKYSGPLAEHELASAYKGATATLLPSFYEGFGLPIVESMAVGTPVITSNITAMPEIAGDASILVDPYSVENITGAIDSLTENSSLHQKLADAGRLRAKLYNWDHSRSIWARTLQQIIS